MGKRIGRKRLYSLDKLGQSETTLEPGAAMSGAFGHGKAMRHGSEIITEIYVDLGAGQVYSPVSTVTGTIIAHSGVLDSSAVQTAPAYIGRVTNAKSGYVNLVEVSCIETPVGGTTDINLIAATSSALVYSGSGGLAKHKFGKNFLVLKLLLHLPLKRPLQKQNQSQSLKRLRQKKQKKTKSSFYIP